MSLREELAGNQHEIWSHWMKYLFSLCSVTADGSYVIPSQSVRHWMRQIDTDYADLTEKEKDSDREQADKVLKVLGESTSCPDCGEVLVKGNIEMEDSWIVAWLCGCEVSAEIKANGS